LAIIIENEEILKENLRTGINLLTGSGFSVLPNQDGEKLPSGIEYAKELIEKYDIKGIKDLDQVANVVPEESLQEYTRKRFNVKSINSEYFLLKRLNLISFITTNYDNIPSLISEGSDDFQLYDIRNGPQKNQKLIPYVPLHGNVLNEEYPIVIGSFSVSAAADYAFNAFSFASNKLKDKPTLIWGYKLSDQPVIKTIKDVLKNKPHSVWILCLPEDESIEYYRQLNCNVIIGDTEGMFNWIKKNIPDVNIIKESSINDEFLSHYLVPENINSVPSAENIEYFKYGIVGWFHIFKSVPYEREIVNTILNDALKYKNVIVTGSEYTGKTTALMQVAIKIDRINKFFFNDLTLATVEYVISRIGTEEVWLFVDNCTNLSLFFKLSQIKNITVIASANELLFESEKYYLSDLSYKLINITELDNNLEAERIYEKIPQNLRCSNFRYKDTPDEKYSMIELVTKNIDSLISKTLIERILLNIYEKDIDSIEVIALTAYLSSRGSALTTDVLMGYFKISVYDEIISLIERVNSLLRNIDDLSGISIEAEKMDQDYYIMRSGLFLLRSKDVFEKRYGNDKLKKMYSEVIKKFIFNVSPVRIWNYEDFKRKEYDSELFYTLYGKYDADEIYEYLYNYAQNLFVKQQQALYHRRGGRYMEAFIEIEDVISKKPNNPSVRNSYAIILFEMNRDEDSDFALDRMKKAMEIFEDLHTRDVRKQYHTDKYVKYAIYLAKHKGNKKYLDTALAWIDELGTNGSENLKKEILGLK